MSLPEPDLQPHVAPAPNGSAACGCRTGLGPQTPQPAVNRPGLDAIAYRIGDYASFRASLHAALSAAQGGALAGLRTREATDFSIGLIDAFACAADVLSFYQERLAHESFLRTATERVSLQELARLVGYRLRPGLAAETWLAFALETPPARPPGLAPEPGNFVTGVPATLRLEAGLQVQSVPGPGEAPQTFETVEALDEARPAWNALRPWLSEARAPGRGDTVAWLDGVATGLRPGDALVFVGDEFLRDPLDNHWDFRLLTRVQAQPEAGRTRVEWARGLGSLRPPMDPARAPQVHALRQRSAPFGHNAPMWAALPASFRRAYPGGAGASDWPQLLLAREPQPAGTGRLDLEAPAPDIVAGSLLVLAKGDFGGGAGASGDTYVELYRVSQAAEASRAEFALSGKVARLRLQGANFETRFRREVRGTTVFARSERLALAAVPVDTPVAGALLPLAAPAEALQPGRRLIVRGLRLRDGQPLVWQARLTAAHALDGARCLLDIAPPLPEPLRRDSVVVHANVIAAAHGETVSQILGSGDAAHAFQRFELRQLPLGWRAAGNARGAEAQIELRVGELAWTERPTLFGAGPDERVYTLAVDADGRQFVQFGDGLRGARLPTGTNNVRARLRKGLGSAGNLPADRLTQLMSRPLGLKSVANPAPASGGTDPEPAAEARLHIPLATRTLGRAVSLLDYEDFARAFGGIGKAQARMLPLPEGPTVALTLAGADGAALPVDGPVFGNLLAALRESGDPTVALRLLAWQPATFRVGLRIKRDPAWARERVLAAVEAALRARFGFAARALGQPVRQSEVIAAAQAVPGVLAVHLTRLYGGTRPAAQARPSVQVRLLADAMHVAGGRPQPAQLLTLAPGPLDLLEELP